MVLLLLLLLLLMVLLQVHVVVVDGELILLLVLVVQCLLVLVMLLLLLRCRQRLAQVPSGCNIVLLALDSVGGVLRRRRRVGQSAIGHEEVGHVVGERGRRMGRPLQREWRRRQRCG